MAEPSSEQLLADMASELKGVNWHDLGTYLHVPQNKLDAIQQEYSDIPTRLTKVLNYRLNNGEMTWEKIIEALTKIGGHANLIIYIESKYITTGQQAIATSAVSNTQLETDDMHVDTVATSIGTENKGALNRATGNEQVVTERVEKMVIVKAPDQMSSNLDGSKQVKIGDEIHSLDVVPAAESKVVAKAKEDLLGAVDLKTLVNDLGHVGAFIRIAYNGVKAAGPRYTELQIEIQQLGFDITKLCDESALTVSKFKRASSTVLNRLEATYGYLLLNKENVAIETLSSVSKIAGDMEKAALTLHEKFEKQEEKVKNTLKETEIAHGDAAVRIEEKKKEHQQLQIQLQHQQKLLDDAQRLEHEAEAQRRQIETRESDAISSIKHIGPLKSLVNALFRYQVFDEGTRKVDLWKEKRIQALEKENMLRKQRYEARERTTSFVVKIQGCKSEQEMAEVTVDALHKTVGVLQELIAAVMRAATFWRQMQEHCRSLADDEMLKNVKMMQDGNTKEERKMMWTSAPFKKQAVHFYAGWVALNSLCSEYVEHIKLTQKDLYSYIVENPTYEESRKNVGELAKKFLADLEKEQKAIAENEFEAQKQIKALMNKIEAIL